MAPRNSKKTPVLCVILTLLYGASPNAINVATKGKVTLKPGVEGEIEDILWKHNGNKMVEWDKSGGPPSEYLTFKNRTKLNTNTGDVTIINLAKDDSGSYEAEIQIAGVLKPITREVKVIDPVTKANITCQTSDAMTTLHCAAAGDSLTYSWSGPGLQTAGMRGQTGPQISQENQDSVYTCEVTNPVSNSSVSFHSNDCFASGNPLPTIIGVVAAVVVSVALAVGVWCYCIKTKQRGQRRTENDTRSLQEAEVEKPLVRSSPAGPNEVSDSVLHVDVDADAVPFSGLSEGYVHGMAERYENCLKKCSVFKNNQSEVKTGQCKMFDEEFTSQEIGDKQHIPEASVHPRGSSSGFSQASVLSQQISHANSSDITGNEQDMPVTESKRYSSSVENMNADINLSDEVGSFTAQSDIEQGNTVDIAESLAHNESMEGTCVSDEDRNTPIEDESTINTSPSDITVEASIYGEQNAGVECAGSSSFIQDSNERQDTLALSEQSSHASPSATIADDTLQTEGNTNLSSVENSNTDEVRSSVTQPSHEPSTEGNIGDAVSAESAEPSAADPEPGNESSKPALKPKPTIPPKPKLT
ncbi:hypothetical protein ACEWY4_001958 [Coilia grayii]|uniref:Ig-like domain-containing protein n=1 Tax=Coilia grayii TaxID=363190 RepID=A0ABD1KUE8_9TELE